MDSFRTLFSDFIAVWCSTLCLTSMIHAKASEWLKTLELALIRLLNISKYYNVAASRTQCASCKFLKHISVKLIPYSSVINCL